MSDLISREAAINALKEYYCEDCTHYDVKCKSPLSENCPIFNVISTIGAMPAIDAEPVRHGKWYWHEEATYNPTEPTEYNSYWACSACGEDIADYLNHALPSCFIFLDSPDYEPTMEYCPHCGAKMDLEDDE